MMSRLLGLVSNWSRLLFVMSNCHESVITDFAPYKDRGKSNYNAHNPGEKFDNFRKVVIGQELHQNADHQSYDDRVFLEPPTI